MIGVYANGKIAVQGSDGDTWIFCNAYEFNGGFGGFISLGHIKPTANDADMIVAGTPEYVGITGRTAAIDFTSVFNDQTVEVQVIIRAETGMIEWRVIEADGDTVWSGNCKLGVCGVVLTPQNEAAYVLNFP